MRVNDETVPHTRAAPFGVDRPRAEERGYRLWAYPLDRYEMRAYLLRTGHGTADPCGHGQHRDRAHTRSAPCAHHRRPRRSQIVPSTHDPSWTHCVKGRPIGTRCGIGAPRVAARADAVQAAFTRTHAKTPALRPDLGTECGSHSAERSENADVGDAAHPRVAAVRGAGRGRARVVHHPVAGVDAHVSGLVDEVTGLRLGSGDHLAGGLLARGAARQVHADLVVDE